ncbi:MAG: TetR/AcrR family transcriptional regulator [Sphingomicrobium sp.]
MISRDPAKVTQRILDAAEREFIEYGFGAASTNRIAARFGGSKATLFRYFSTKEALLEAVIERIASEWRLGVRLGDLHDGEPRQWLVDFATMVLAWILGKGPLFVGRLGISEGHKFSGLTPVFQDVAGKPLESALAARLGSWTTEGILSSPDPANDARMFFDLVVSGAVSRALYGVEILSGDRLSAHVARATDLFMRGRLPRV